MLLIGVTIGGKTRDADEVRRCVFESRKCDIDDDEDRGVASRVIGDDDDTDSNVPITKLIKNHILLFLYTGCQTQCLILIDLKPFITAITVEIQPNNINL